MWNEALERRVGCAPCFGECWQDNREVPCKDTTCSKLALDTWLIVCVQISTKQLCSIWGANGDNMRQQFFRSGRSQVNRSIRGSAMGLLRPIHLYESPRNCLWGFKWGYEAIEGEGKGKLLPVEIQTRWQTGIYQGTVQYGKYVWEFSHRPTDARERTTASAQAGQKVLYTFRKELREGLASTCVFGSLTKRYDTTLEFHIRW